MELSLTKRASHAKVRGNSICEGLEADGKRHIWKNGRKAASWSLVREGLCAVTDKLPNLSSFRNKMCISWLSVFLVRRWLSSKWPFRALPSMVPLPILYGPRVAVSGLQKGKSL